MKTEYKRYLKYPHLSPEDSLIWNRFILRFPDYFFKVSYDLKVGKPRDYSKFPKGKIRDDLELLSRKRIDVVGWRKNQIYIMELKPSASFSALGQALGLAELFRRDFYYKEIIKPCVITNQEIPDIKELAEKQDILYFVV